MLGRTLCWVQWMRRKRKGRRWLQKKTSVKPEEPDLLTQIDEINTKAMKEGAFMETVWGQAVTAVTLILAGCLVLWELYLNVVYKPQRAEEVMMLQQASPGGAKAMQKGP
mmetsp:Transcript_34658/g.68383  ORF Transcript_34658/g.68383 Transcript_34658/m.68383 type:complete len:110 (+) Transcript_34658:295-624(+)